MMEFEQIHETYLLRCDEGLAFAVDNYFQEDSVVSQAAEYSLLGGGKRVRGVLTLATCEMLGGAQDTAEHYAAAIEMIHAFSLVHDDLPCMDDDDLRRGRPSAHIQYGEANALLAGDLLAIQAFEALARAPGHPGQNARAVSCLARACGAKGMLYGQELDLQFENKAVNQEQLLLTYRHKTGALLSAAVELGILAADKAPEDHPELVHYAQRIGLAFQIVDDILDVTSTDEALGKPIGSDADNRKNTYVSILGVDEAKQKVFELTQNAAGDLQRYPKERVQFLTDFAWNLSERIH